MRDSYRKVVHVALLAVLTTPLVACADAEEPPADPAATTEELKAMHTSLHEVGELIDAASAGAAQYQDVVRTVQEEDSAALLTDRRIAEALANQQEREDARDRAIAELGEMPAMADPKVAGAYDDFWAAAEKMFTFQDGYNASMPDYLRAVDLCMRILNVDVKMDVVTSSIPGAFESQWLEEHRRLAQPCQGQLVPLAESDNYWIREYGDSTRRLITERTAAMTGIGYTEAATGRAVARLKKANDAFLARQEKISAFSEELERLSAVDEYQTLDAVLEDRLGPDESGSDPPA